jgi:hypothetical protein
LIFGEYTMRRSLVVSVPPPSLLVSACAPGRRARGRPVDQHRVRQHDVLVDAQRHARERRLHEVRVGQRLEEVAAHDEERIEIARVRGVDHLARVEPRVRGRGEAPQFRDRRVAQRAAARQRHRHAADFRAALDARVPADRHDAGAVPADHAAGEREVDDRAHARGARDVLRHPHAPHEDGAPGAGVERGEALHRLACGAGRLRQRVPRGGARLRLDLGEVLGVGFDPRAVFRAPFEQRLEDAGEERAVAALVEREVVVEQLSSRRARSRRRSGSSRRRARARAAG